MDIISKTRTAPKKNVECKVWNQGKESMSALRFLEYKMACQAI